ncbi:hypothetical protein AAY55_02775 [Vibrio metoecus]|uniref:Uncharacterized protein n=1 Tax=Vibrio metoecus TaxID=1481663 RepID=A0A0Q0JSQ2_VIBMT|nr:hypothetical protein AAY55_02775 [Vibrio metoecus]
MFDKLYDLYSQSALIRLYTRLLRELNRAYLRVVISIEESVFYSLMAIILTTINKLVIKDVIKYAEQIIH